MQQEFDNIVISQFSKDMIEMKYVMSNFFMHAPYTSRLKNLSISCYTIKNTLTNMESESANSALRKILTKLSTADQLFTVLNLSLEIALDQSNQNQSE